MIAIQVVDASEGTDLTQIFVTLIVTTGVIVTAVLSYLGVKAGRQGVKAAEVAADVAAQTERSNTADHGKVAAALGDLRKEMLAGFSAVRDEIGHLTGRLDDVAHNTGAARDQLIAHQQWHMDHPPPSKETP